MMHGHEKSDLAIVAMKPANKVAPAAEQSAEESAAAESVERRAGTKGNANQQTLDSDAGNLHVRFDERNLETEPWLIH